MIVQTIRIYKNETIQIETILPRDLQQNLTIIDQQIIKTIEKKTKKIVMDTLRETKSGINPEDIVSDIIQSLNENGIKLHNYTSK